ncbi:MAG: PPOX class F420-dependent oxidoreductase [Actinobacteria bacterium]|uniref:Unannotated protein n=1 Tax=freshwater metagenome TaxID=449393 RepID=A0A6J7A9H6_9ZZZZ|nr:PPOX class F420-dependent oxidoreductase [Actinomycetota bacterium]
MTAPDTSALDAAKYVALTTFRRNGDPVTTPIWTVQHMDGWACTTGPESGKVKRLRHTARIEVAPCDFQGRVADDAPRFLGTGRVVTDRAEFSKISKAVSKKYWILSTAMDLWEQVASLFRTRETEGAVAWTVDGPA